MKIGGCYEDMWWFEREDMRIMGYFFLVVSESLIKEKLIVVFLCRNRGI